MQNEQKDLKNKKKSGLINFILKAVISGFIIFIAGCAYLYFITPKSEHTGLFKSISFMVSPGKIVFRDSDKINILCLGLDYNYDEKGIHYTKDARSDTIFIISLDINSKNVNILSIPRDVYLEYAEGRGYDKINAAYAYGGIDLAKKTIEKFLGIKCDYYVLIKIYGAQKLVDAIGGVNVYVDKDMDYDDNWGNLHVHLKKGFQKLNGEQAVGFCRYRHDEMGDRSRMQRQQRFLKALIKEMLKPENLLKIEEISKITKQNIDTNLSFLQILDIVRVYRNFDFSQVHGGQIDGTDDYAAGQAVIIPDEEKKDLLVKKLILGVYTYTPEDIKINIKNESNRKGVGKKVSELFINKGYVVENVSDDGGETAETYIINEKNIKQSQDLILHEMGNVKILDGKTPETSEVDYTIVIGNDFAEKVNNSKGEDL